MIKSEEPTRVTTYRARGRRKYSDLEVKVAIPLCRNTRYFKILQSSFKSLPTLVLQSAALICHLNAHTLACLTAFIKNIKVGLNGSLDIPGIQHAVLNGSYK